MPKAGPIALPEPEASLERYEPLFANENPQCSPERCSTGLLSDLRRKDCDSITQVIMGPTCSGCTNRRSTQTGTPMR